MSRHSPFRGRNTGGGDASAQCGGGFGETGAGSQIRRDPTRWLGFALNQLGSRTDFAAARDLGVAHYIGVKTPNRWHARALDAPLLDRFRVNSPAAKQEIANFRGTESMSVITCLRYPKDPMEDL